MALNIEAIKPEIATRILADKDALYLKGSMYWHIDGTMNEVPILASILSAKYLPPEGGQTEFCNTYAPYDALPYAPNSGRLLHRTKLEGEEAFA
jgi:alpha-ketoglutarate-dependent taurine dioxygenase